MSDLLTDGFLLETLHNYELYLKTIETARQFGLRLLSIPGALQDSEPMNRTYVSAIVADTDRHEAEVRVIIRALQDNLAERERSTEHRPH